MIFGHEGMPRSGKSAQAMPLIADALLAGRTVVTNIAGINRVFFAEKLAIPLPTVERLLVTIEPPATMPEEKVVPWVKAEFFNRRVKDSFWIWDEINQFWPPDRQPLDAEWAKFVTEHGHLGIDVLIMGQDLSELHKTWRNRLQRYTRFTKLDMQGKDDEFHWASYTNVGRGRYRQAAAGKKPYDQEYFGAYKSHEDGTTNKANYRDGRFSVFQRKHKIMAAVFGLGMIFAVWQVVAFFSLGKESDQVQPSTSVSAPAAPAAPVVPAAPASAPVSTVAAVVSPEPESPALDYLDDVARRFRPRLSAILDRSVPQDGQPAFDFVLEFVDESYHVKERMGRREVVALGWSLKRTDYGLELSKEGRVYVVRPWPLDNFGRAPAAQIAALKPGES